MTSSYIIPITSIAYSTAEYDPLMDLCNMNMDDWANEQFDGFVILHGTDTMCYTWRISGNLPSSLELRYHSLN